MDQHQEQYDPDQLFPMQNHGDQNFNYIRAFPPLVPMLVTGNSYNSIDNTYRFADGVQVRMVTEDFRGSTPTTVFSSASAMTFSSVDPNVFQVGFNDPAPAFPPLDLQQEPPVQPINDVNHGFGIPNGLAPNNPAPFQQEDLQPDGGLQAFQDPYHQQDAVQQVEAAPDQPMDFDDGLQFLNDFEPDNQVVPQQDEFQLVGVWQDDQADPNENQVPTHAPPREPAEAAPAQPMDFDDGLQFLIDFEPVNQVVPQQDEFQLVGVWQDDQADPNENQVPAQAPPPEPAEAPPDQLMGFDNGLDLFDLQVPVDFETVRRALFPQDGILSDEGLQVDQDPNHPQEAGDGLPPQEEAAEMSAAAMHNVQAPNPTQPPTDLHQTNTFTVPNAALTDETPAFGNINPSPVPYWPDRNPEPVQFPSDQHNQEAEEANYQADSPFSLFEMPLARSHMGEAFGMEFEFEMEVEPIHTASPEVLQDPVDEADDVEIGESQLETDSDSDSDMEEVGLGSKANVQVESEGSEDETHSDSDLDMEGVESGSEANVQVASEGPEDETQSADSDMEGVESESEANVQVASEVSEDETPSDSDLDSDMDGVWSGSQANVESDGSEEDSPMNETEEEVLDNDTEEDNELEADDGSEKKNPGETENENEDDDGPGTEDTTPTNETPSGMMQLEEPQLVVERRMEPHAFIVPEAASTSSKSVHCSCCPAQCYTFYRCEQSRLIWILRRGNGQLDQSRWLPLEEETWFGPNGYRTCGQKRCDTCALLAREGNRESPLCCGAI